MSGKHSNEGLYLTYENWIRTLESATCGLTAMGGCLFGIRTSIVQGTKQVGNKLISGFKRDLQSDFRSALMAKTFGYRAVIDRDAVATFADGEESKEFDRKHRTIVRGLNNFFHHLYLLDPFRYGLFSYALFNHKLMKWLVPFFMIGAFVSNSWLLGDGIYNVLFTLQLIFYSFAFSEWDNKFIKIAHFFVITNLAILKAWYSYARGERFIMWQPTVRK